MIVKVNNTEYPLTTYMATGITEGFEESTCFEQEIAAWQCLVLSGVVWRLQGWFGRTAKTLLDRGVIKSKLEYDKEVGITVDFDAFS